MCFLFFFFFSSRRRHTRLTCDWSSDVCSSDLGGCLSGRRIPASRRVPIRASCRRLARGSRPRQKLGRRAAAGTVGWSYPNKRSTPRSRYTRLASRKRTAGRLRVAGGRRSSPAESADEDAVRVGAVGLGERGHEGAVLDGQPFVVAEEQTASVRRLAQVE